MIYEYIHDETGEVIEEDYPMTEEIPITIFKDGKEYRRVFSSVATHIPEDWGSTDNKLDFTKSPSGRKHYY